MILVGNQRGGSKQMALHLLSDENEHITVHAIDGFIADDLEGAMQEAHAISKSTRCTKHLFSLSLSPPIGAIATEKDFENGIDKVENKLGLTGQPKVIVFHEKEGRRHAHCVWSRIHADELKAIKLNYYKKDLNVVSKDLFIEHGWDLPNGFKEGQSRDRRNFTLEEYQQAKRHNLNAKQLKARIQHCWKISDDKNSFEHALEHEGFFLARGDKKNVHVAVDWHGEVYAITRATGELSKVVKAKLGEPDTLRSVAATKATIEKEQSNLHEKLKRELQLKHRAQNQPLQARKRELVQAQRAQRQTQGKQHQQRQQLEQQQRQSHYQRGLRGLWSFVTGRYHKQKQRHEQEYQAGLKRDAEERQSLIQQQLIQRQQLQEQLEAIRNRQQLERMKLNADFVKKDIVVEQEAKNPSQSIYYRKGPEL